MGSTAHCMNMLKQSVQRGCPGAVSLHMTRSGGPQRATRATHSIGYRCSPFSSRGTPRDKTKSATRAAKRSGFIK